MTELCCGETMIKHGFGTNAYIICPICGNVKPHTIGLNEDTKK